MKITWGEGLGKHLSKMIFMRCVCEHISTFRDNMDNDSTVIFELN